MENKIRERLAAICVFMGCKVYSAYTGENWSEQTVKGEVVKEWRAKGLKVGGFNDSMILSNCHFNSSWDWLMPVVKKMTWIINSYSAFEKGYWLADLPNRLMDADIDYAFTHVSDFCIKHNELKMSKIK